jgi:oleate hydratase
VFNSTYDVRTQLTALRYLRDGKELDIPGPDLPRKLLMKKLDSTEIGELLKEAHLISD